MNKNQRTIAAAAALVLLGGSSVAMAADWVFRLGGHDVQPKSDNHAIVNVDAGYSLTFSATYQYTPHWGVELLGALPFSHDINLNSNGAKVAEVKQLPPTLTVEYNFLPGNRIRPYIGAGLNATLFFDEKTRGTLAGTDLKLGTSFGPAAKAGVDVDIGSAWFLSVDARWMDIDTDAKLGGVSIGSVGVDPFAVGISIGRRFGGK